MDFIRYAVFYLGFGLLLGGLGASGLWAWPGVIGLPRQSYLSRFPNASSTSQWPPSGSHDALGWPPPIVGNAGCGAHVGFPSRCGPTGDQMVPGGAPGMATGGAPIHHVIHGTGVLYAKFSCHRWSDTRRGNYLSIPLTFRYDWLSHLISLPLALG